ncbi:MAG TPA: alpha/beta hydrolase [Acidimicrobiales bacterium]|nr:alpha/beta hydrolase [Acidimicrobiales bacterium]
MPLDPVTAQINDLIVGLREGAPAPTVETMRAGYVQLIEQIGTTTTTCKVEPIDVDGLPSLSFTPPECEDGLLVWFHGGGWVISDPEHAINEVDRLAVAARCRAISVGYRLAPEHPFPQPQLDAVVAANWCVANAASLGADPRRVAVGGDSAGGNLAAVAAQRVDGLCAQLLVYPGCDLREATRQTQPYPEGYILDRGAIDFFLSCALGDADPADPMISPQVAMTEILTEAPPALVITAEYDPLRDDGRTYAATLRAAGVHVETREYDRQTHLFFSMPEALEDARDAIEVAGAFLASQFDAV